MNFSGEYPLVPTDVPVGSNANATLTFNLGASTAQYFSFQSDGASPDMRVELTSSSGVNVADATRAGI